MATVKGHPSRGFVLALLLVVPMAIAPPPARAAGAVFGLKPVGQPPRSGFFVLAGRPGAVLTARLQVVNVSSRAGEVRLYPADATTGQTTGAVYRGASRARADVGAWIVLERTRLSLGPRQAAAVGFRVRVPAQVRPGQHLGGIVAEPVAVTATQRARRGRARFSVKVKEQAIIAVQVNLPGAGPQRLAITRLRAGANPGYQTLLIGLANTGNVFLKGRGTITVTTRGGRRLRRQAFALDTFVPRTSVDDPIVVRGRALPAGRYLGRIAIAYGNGHHVSRTLPFTVSARQLKQVFGSSGARPPGDSGTSWWVYALAGLGLVLLGAGGSAAFQRARRPRVPAAPPAGPEPSASAPPVDGEPEPVGPARAVEPPE